MVKDAMSDLDMRETTLKVLYGEEKNFSRKHLPANSKIINYSTARTEGKA
jgi:hypothetical protein